MAYLILPNSALGLTIFFLTVLFLYRLAPTPWKWAILLASSCLFYVSLEPRFFTVVALQAVLIYLLGLGLEGGVEKHRSEFFRRSLLTLGIVSLIGPWAVLRYVKSLGPDLGIAIPLGISFYTFQALSYLIDVYWGRIPAERHFGHLAAYKTFFPQMVAGPIERAEKLLPQIKAPPELNPLSLRIGLSLIVIGVFKKFAVGNNLLPFLDATHADPERYAGFPILLASVLARFRMYFELSGYADIAIGASRTFGILIGPNFDRPFAAVSVADYWRRWNITLINWFRDYVFFPLCRVNSGRVGIRLNVFLLFVLVGLWHGSSWGWLIFGIVNAVFMLFGNWTASLRARLWDVLGIEAGHSMRRASAILSTFLHLCIPSFIATSDSLSDASNRFIHLIRGGETWFNGAAFLHFWRMEQVPLIFLLTLACIPAVEVLQAWWVNGGRERWTDAGTHLRFAVLLAIWSYFVVFANMDQLGFAYSRY